MSNPAQERHTSKLTKIKLEALEKMNLSPRKSGAFWRDLGISPQLIARLEDAGLVGAGYRQATGETTILRRAWSLTDAGRAALANGDEGK